MENTREENLEVISSACEKMQKVAKVCKELKETAENSESDLYVGLVAHAVNVASKKLSEAGDVISILFDTSGGDG